MIRNVGLGQLLVIVLTIILVTGPGRTLGLARKVGRIPTQVGDLSRKCTGAMTAPKRGVEIGRGLGRISRRVCDLLRELTRAG